MPKYTKRPRGHNLNRTTQILQARQVADHYSRHTFTYEGWKNYLKTTKAPEHAVNGLLRHESELPDSLVTDAIAMTIAWCMDYKWSAQQAADAIIAARQRKAIKMIERNEQSGAV